MSETTLLISTDEETDTDIYQCRWSDETGCVLFSVLKKGRLLSVLVLDMCPDLPFHSASAPSALFIHPSALNKHSYSIKNLIRLGG